MSDRFSLKNKIIIVTGGAGFLANFHIKALSEKNGTIIVIDKNSESIIKQKKFFRNNKKITFYECDITNKKSLFSINKKILKKFKKIDVLINNAFNDYKVAKGKKYKTSKSNFGIENLNKDIEVGLIGTVNCIDIFSKSMLKKKKGVILNIGYDLSVISPNQNLYEHLNIIKPVGYSVGKHGLIGITKYFATLWGKRGIRINTLSPGAIEFNQDKKFKKKIKTLIPLGRMCKGEELKEITQFLCSDASSYMTGQNIILDGGRSIW